MMVIKPPHSEKSRDERPPVYHWRRPSPICPQWKCDKLTTKTRRAFGLSNLKHLIWSILWTYLLNVDWVLDIIIPSYKEITISRKEPFRSFKNEKSWICNEASFCDYLNRMFHGLWNGIWFIWRYHLILMSKYTRIPLHFLVLKYTSHSFWV